MAFGAGPDGRLLLASGSSDKTVRLWDPVTGAPVGEPLTGHTGLGALGGVRDRRRMAGLLLASGSGDKTVRLWDPVTGAPVGEPLPATRLGALGGVRHRRRTAACCWPPAAATGRCGCGTRSPAPRSASR